MLQFKPVIWNFKADKVRELPLPPGDSVGMAFWVNDKKQAVGSTATCANTIVPPFVIGACSHVGRAWSRARSRQPWWCPKSVFSCASVILVVRHQSISLSDRFVPSGP